MKKTAEERIKSIRRKISEDIAGLERLRSELSAETKEVEGATTDLLDGMRSLREIGVTGAELHPDQDSW